MPGETPVTPPLAAAEDSRANPPAVGREAQPPATRDAHGFDPTAYEWIPVPRQRRVHGWSPEKQRAFIAHLADTGSVVKAAAEVDMTVKSAYELRRAKDGEQFAAAWEAAIHQAMRRLAEVALDRALNGVEEPVFDEDGRRIACRYRYNDRLLMFLLRAHMPERYRHAHNETRRAGEAPPPALPSVAEAIERLEPAPPAEPHLLLSPEDLERRVSHVRHLGDGGFNLPETADGRVRPKCDYPDPALAEYPGGEEFERGLAWSMAGVSPPPSTGWPRPPFEGCATDEEDGDNGETRRGPVRRRSRRR